MPDYHPIPSFDPASAPFPMYYDKQTGTWTGGPPGGQDTGERRVLNGFETAGTADTIPESPEIGQQFYLIEWRMPVWWDGVAWCNSLGIPFTAEQLANPPA